MKLTVKQLRTIIKEETRRLVEERTAKPEDYPTEGTMATLPSDMKLSPIGDRGGLGGYFFSNSGADAQTPAGTVVRVVGRVLNPFLGYSGDEYVVVELEEFPRGYDVATKPPSFSISPKQGALYAMPLKVWQRIA